MKVLLIDIDSKFPNLALKKIEKYHTDRGDEIFWNIELMRSHVDKIYVSCIFTENRDKCKEWEGIAQIGGSGYDLLKELPFEIQQVRPRINVGFTTRGCIRNCPFCIVPQKEGMIRPEAEIPDIWDGKSKRITLLDNNILALPEHFELIYWQLRRYKLFVDFNQGLDMRLIDNPRIVQMLADLKYIKRLRISWDRMKDEIFFDLAISRLLKRFKASRIMIYMLTGFDTTFQEDMYRLKKIQSHGCEAFVMRFHKSSMLLNEFASWNNRFYFRNTPFEKFLKHRKHLHLLETVS